MSFVAPDSEQQRHGVRFETPRGEEQRLRRRHVEPVGVIDDDEERRALCRDREQAQRRCRDRETIARSSRSERERPPKAVRLRLGDRVKQAEERPADLHQRRERKLSLRLHTSGRNDRHSAGLLGRVLEEGALPYPGLTLEYQGGAATASRARDSLFDPCALDGTPDKHVATVATDCRADKNGKDPPARLAGPPGRHDGDATDTSVTTRFSPWAADNAQLRPLERRLARPRKKTTTEKDRGHV